MQDVVISNLDNAHEKIVSETNQTNFCQLCRLGGQQKHVEVETN